MSAGIATVGAVAVAFSILQFIAFFRLIATSRFACAAWIESCRDGKRRLQPRETAIADLERSLAGLYWGILLRRLGIVAPLIGVMLTAISIALGGSGGAEAMNSGLGPIGQASMASGAATLQGLAPLLAGVVAGAALAVLNQILCIQANFLEERALRVSVETSSDELFRDTDYRIDDVVNGIAAAGDSLARATTLLADVARVTADLIKSTRDDCVSAGAALEEAAQRLRNSLDEPIRSIVEAAADTRHSVDRLGEDLRLAGSGFVRSSSDVAAALERSVASHAGTVQAHGASVQALQGTVAALRAVADELGTISVSEFAVALRDGSASLRADSRSLSEAMRDIVSVHGEFRRDLEQVPGFAQLVSARLAQIEAALSDLESPVRRLAAEAAELRSGVAVAAEAMRVFQDMKWPQTLAAPSAPAQGSRLGGLFSPTRSERPR